MLRRIKDGVKYYIQHTDLLLMVLALVICLFGLVLIWSSSQPQIKEGINPQRAMMVQCIGIGLGFVGMIILSLMDFERFPWLWAPMAVFNVAFQISLCPT